MSVMRMEINVMCVNQSIEMHMEDVYRLNACLINSMKLFVRIVTHCSRIVKNVRNRME